MRNALLLYIISCEAPSNTSCLGTDAAPRKQRFCLAEDSGVRDHGSLLGLAKDRLYSSLR